MEILELLKESLMKGTQLLTIPWSHQYYHSMSVDQQRNDLLTMHQEMINRFGYTMKYFVFPSETTSERSLAVVGSCGYKTLGFTCYYADYDMRNQKPPQVAMDILNRGAFPGAVYYRIQHPLQTQPF